MSSEAAVTRDERHGERLPLLNLCALRIALRYLLRRRLSFLAIAGVALSVGVLIVVMSVFNGFHTMLTSAIRGYLSDLKIRPANAKMNGLTDWQAWRQKALRVPHVVGVAPFIEGFGLVALPNIEHMQHVFFRGVDPRYEATVSDLPRYMRVGKLSDLNKTYANPKGGRMRACFVGKLFVGFRPEDHLYNPATLDVRPGRIIMVTATASLERRLAQYAVNGLFETTNSQYDSMFVIMGLQTAMDLVASNGAVTGLNVKLDDYDNAESVRAELEKRLAPGALLRTLGGPDDVASAVAISGDDARVATLCADGTVRLWQVATGEPVLAAVPTSGPERAALALSPDGEEVAIGHIDGSAFVLNASTGGPACRVEAAGSAVTALAFSPDGFSLAVGREDGSIRLYDAETGELLRTLDAHARRVGGVEFDPGSRWLLSWGAGAVARLWDAESGSQVAGFGDGTASPMTCAAYAPDGTVVATGHEDGRVQLWRVPRGGLIGTLEAGKGRVLAVGFRGSSGQVMTATREAVRLWQAHVGSEGLVAREYLRISPGGGAHAAVFSPDGKRTVVLADTGAVRVYHTGERFYTTTWEEEQKTFLEAVGMERFLMALILSLILVVAEFFIFAIVITIVNERRRDIGILKATGFRQGQICLIFLSVGLAIGLIGAALGVAWGVVFAHHINAVREFVRATIGFDPFPADVYYFKDIPVQVGYLTPALTGGGAIVCSLLFSIIPALRAARTDPAQTLHYE